MKNKKLNSSKVLLFFAGATTALVGSGATLAIVNSKTTKDNVQDVKGNVFKYITFKAGNTGATLTGKTTVPVKPGKIFHTVTERPVATLAGYDFVCWSATEFTPGSGSISDAFPETTAINQNCSLYPIFAPIGVTSVEVIGTTSLRQEETAYYKAIVTPSYAKTTEVEWKVFDEDPSTTEPQTQSTKATITKVTTGEHAGEGLLTPKAAAATGDVWVQATTTDGSSKRHSIKVEIIPATPTSVTTTIHSGSSSSIKVGGTTIIDAVVGPAGATQKVDWTIKPSTGSKGSAEIVTAGDTQLTIKGVTEGKVSITARAHGTSVTSNVTEITITKSTVTGITVSGPTRMDIKDQSQYNATISPIGSETSVTWHAYEEEACQTASTIASIDQKGVLSVLPTASLEDGSKYVYVRASSNESGSSVVSNVVAVRVFDVMSFMYSYVDSDGDRWIYDSRTIETNNKETSITRYCYDDPSKKYTPVARSEFNEPIVIGKWITALGEDFLAECTSFNSKIYFDSPIADITNLESIADGFLFGCTSFNQQFNIPATVRYIGADFMEGCKAYAQPITISDNVRFVGDYFMHNCHNFKELRVDTVTDFAQVWTESLDVVSVREEQVPAYQNGVSVSGAGSQAFVALYGNLSGEQTPGGYSVWRNLVQGAVPITVDGIKYTIVEGTQTCIVYGLDSTFTGTELTIPTTITHESTTYTVVGIANNAFRSNTTLTSVTIPASVTSIGDYSFYENTALTTVTFEENSTLDSVGYAAFARCEDLVSCTLPQSVTVIDDGAFFLCSSLGNANISNLFNLTYIGVAAFAACLYYNERIQLPASLQTLGTAAFYDCEAIPYVRLPKFTNTCEVGTDVFTGCSSLDEIDVYQWTAASTEGWNVTIESGAVLFDSVSPTGTLTYTTGLDEDAIKKLFADWSNGSIVFGEGLWTATAA